MPRRFIVLAASLCAPVLLAGLALLLLPRLDLGSLAAARAGGLLGRPVTIASLRVTPGRWTRIEMGGLVLGNLEGGTRPAMLEVARAGLEVDTLSLLRGPPVLRAVAVERASLLLEHVADGRANWRFGPPPPAGTGGGRAIPTLLDAALREAEVAVRTSRGHLLRTRLERAEIRAGDDAAPVRLAAEGSYEAVPVTLHATLAPIARLRELPRPQAARLRLASGGTVLEFDGRMTDPFDVDGADGRAVLHAPTPDRLLALAGAAAELDAPLRLEGRLEHHGPVWRLSEGRGELAGEGVAVRLAQFTEGAAGQPDAVALDLGLGRLDLNRRLAAGSRAGLAEADLPLVVSAAPDPRLEARITVEDLAYARLQARDVQLHGSLEPGRIAVRTFGLTTSGARLRASGEVLRREPGAAVAAEVRLEEGDLETMRRSLGLRDLPLSGRIDGWVAVAAEGETLNGAALAARVSAVVAMQEGRIAREVIEMGSTDLRLLFRRARGTTPVACLLGMLEMRAGLGEVAPLRIRSAEGTIAGTAGFDLNRRRLDLVVGSLRSTTAFWALDIPMRVSGRFGDPEIWPARWSADGRARLAAADDVAPLPARLRDFAAANPCFQAGPIPVSPRRPAPPRTTSRSRRR